MSEPFSRIRRILVCGIALAGSAWMLRSPLAQALVTRGDDYLYAGNRYQAFVHYRRSFALDPDSELAVDRIAFVAALQTASAGIASGVGSATAYLHRHPRSSKILADRGLCNLKLHRFDAAFRDFYRAAVLTGDPQTYTFAGWAAKRAGHPVLASRMWRRALAVAPEYRPALLALRKRTQ
jgi:tetratricopeptide (TPR) repeat protein